MATEVEEDFESLNADGECGGAVGIQELGQEVGVAGKLESVARGNVGRGRMPMVGLEAGPDEEAERQRSVVVILGGGRGRLAEDRFHDGGGELGVGEGAGERSLEGRVPGVGAEEAPETGSSVVDRGEGGGGEETREEGGKEWGFGA